MPNDCVIRRMTLDDLDAVVAIEAATFPTPWSRDSFQQELEQSMDKSIQEIQEKIGKEEKAA